MTLAINITDGRSSNEMCHVEMQQYIDTSPYCDTLSSDTVLINF